MQGKVKKCPEIGTQMCHELEMKATDYEKHWTFRLKLLARMEIVNHQPWKLLWGDEAHFYLKGSVNTPLLPNLGL
ncbi:hypothetical protein CEXT_548241 [Caerostris extrusa]|uniref:Transposase n=1 Tax=Caerostris extrusa TaxID=172846 RepID=A0AAV4P8A3_CAEEX|nr:hypothetical protein CEXT_548241 [Caerostris extrusa]